MTSLSFSAAFSKAFATTSFAGGQPITLLEMIKLQLGIDPADTSEDEKLERAINLAGDHIETYLDRIVAKRETTEYFPHHVGTVVLHNLPADLSAPITVTLDGDVQTDFKPYLGRGKLCYLSRIGVRPDVPMDWRNFDQVEITYTAGFDPIPSDLAYAITSTAILFYQAEGTGSMAGGGGGTGEIKSVSVYDVGSVSYDVGGSASGGSGAGFFGAAGVIPDTAAQMLMRYKRMSA